MNPSFAAHLLSELELLHLLECQFPLLQNENTKNTSKIKDLGGGSRFKGVQKEAREHFKDNSKRKPQCTHLPCPTLELWLFPRGYDINTETGKQRQETVVVRQLGAVAEPRFLRLSVSY